MTTIVITPTMIIADTKIYDSAVNMYGKKVRIYEGRAIAGSGDRYPWLKFVTGEEVVKCDKEQNDFTACMILTKTGKMIHWDNLGLIEEEVTKTSFWAMGSGRRLALGAMAAGATPIEALGIAAKYDAGTGTGYFGYRIVEGVTRGFEKVESDE